ncbi:MAG TPA: hypothetical protein VMZ06_06330 [Candidatus Bathyarchaeia archaeon]|nr:hypothetical protein [Candidatus Bathyarchaeia archaeon]
MRVSKEYIMALSALIAVLGAVGGGYQFYYRERLDEYQKNIADEEKFADVLTALGSGFDYCPPQDLIKAVNGEVNPMVEELHRRAAFYQVLDLREIQPIPEGKMLGFYYREEFQRLFTEFRQQALASYPTCIYPRDNTFGAPRPDEFTGVEISKREVESALRKITFGLEMMRLLMQSKAAYITDVQLWLPRLSPNRLFTEYVVGLSFAMMPKDLVAFLDKLRVGEVLGQPRYVNVNALSIQNKYLRWPMEPPVEVQMLVMFVQANVDETAPVEGVEVAETASTEGSKATAEEALQAWRGRIKSVDGARGDRMRDVPTTKWGKFKRWMRRNFWPF